MSRDLRSRDHVRPVPKPMPRMKDANAGKAKMIHEGRCRRCRKTWRQLALLGLGLSRHHLVPKGQGDDVDANLVPLCGHGTIGCHGEVEHYRGDARRDLRQRLTSAEVFYIVERKGEGWLDRHYPPV